MSYSARISSSNPHAIVILVDQSGSMSENISWRGNTTTKADALSEVINTTIAELMARCNHYGDYRHFFDIAVYGYSGRGVYSLLDDNTPFISSTYLAHSAHRAVEITNVRNMPDGKQITTHYKQKIWVEPSAEGNTPMYEALQKTFDILSAWIMSRDEKISFPPLVINITDGEATDATDEKLIKISQKVRSLKTPDGNTILLNVHISANSKKEILFPTDGECPLGDNQAATLYEMSSVMPQLFEQEISAITNNKPPYKGFAFNASIADLMRMLNISSSTAQITV